VHTYLLDMYAYTQAITEAAPALAGAYEGAASRIAGECPGVLVGAPQANEIEVAPSILRRTARQRGEEKRQSRQLSDLEEELASGLAYSEQGSRQPATRALLANLEALPQAGPALSRVVHTQRIGLEESQKVENTDVCADMEAWAGSGYRTLSQASRATALKRETELAGFLTDLAAQSASESVTLMETPADKALVRKTAQLETQAAKTIANSTDSARKRVEAALGLTARTKREEILEPISHESKSSTELGAGHTAAGTSYTVWLERTNGGSADTCKSSVEVRKADGVKPGILELLSSTGPEVCLAPRKDRSEEPSVNCSKGLITIKTEVLSTTRMVDLRMSNGTRIVSRSVLVPRRLGGPGAFYYQAVRGPSPFPVSLTERDARGHTLRVLKLRRIVGCSKHPLKYLPGGSARSSAGALPRVRASLSSANGTGSSIVSTPS
jgi:hypothetical protein